MINDFSTIDWVQSSLDILAEFFQVIYSVFCIVYVLDNVLRLKGKFSGQNVILNSSQKSQIYNYTYANLTAKNLHLSNNIGA